jgi:hypothetical protein
MLFLFQMPKYAINYPNLGFERGSYLTTFRYKGMGIAHHDPFENPVHLEQVFE